MGETIITSDGIEYTEAQLYHIINEIKDYQLTHGSLLKVVQHETESSVPARPVGTSILPTVFPRKHFEEALVLQQTFNELYIRVASDPDWLWSVLEPLLKHDDFLAALWSVYEKTRDSDTIQDMVCGVFRSDYMIHQTLPNNETNLKQVELNAFSCAGACHAERIVSMHHHLGKVRGVSSESISRSLPDNTNTESIVKLLKSAHDTYTATISRNKSRQRCILMPVQPFNFNIADERPIQYRLYDAGVPCYRCEWQSVLHMTTLMEDRTLLFRPILSDMEFEVSVVYYRAGYEVHEYEGQVKDTRLRLETSLAIKCPDVLTHLTTSKCVQQALTLSGALERFLSADKCDRVRNTFMPMQILDSSPAGLEAQDIAKDPKRAVNYVLKPNRDGGGNNIYREQIPAFLSKQPREEWSKYILMRLIEPPTTTGTLMMPEDLYLGNVVSELGILGTCLWTRGLIGKDRNAVNVMSNETAGFTFKSKPEEVDEMSVVKGYGCFDCPLLVG